MKILLIRHAIAVPHGTPGFTDDERSLTPKGEKRFRKAARGLAAIVPRPQALLSSSLPRALQTAQIAAATWGEVELLANAVDHLLAQPSGKGWLLPEEELAHRQQRVVDRRARQPVPRAAAEPRGHAVLDEDAVPGSADDPHEEKADGRRADVDHRHQLSLPALVLVAPGD